MKSLFTEPEVFVVRFEEQDVITDSSCLVQSAACPYETGGLSA